LAMIDVRLLDHIIVGGCDTISFAERGLIAGNYGLCEKKTTRPSP